VTGRLRAAAATLRRNARLTWCLLRSMPPSAWHRLATFALASGVARLTGWRPLDAVVLPFRAVTVHGRVGRPNGLKFLVEIAAHDVYRALRPAVEAGVRTLYDVGANCGYFALSRCRSNPVLSAWCFEPRSETFEALQRNIELNGLTERVTAVQAAVSDAPGKLPLDLPPSSSMGVVRPELRGETAPTVAIVDALTLDSFAADHPPPDALKIDVEGHERAVLVGAAQVLTAVRALAMEVHSAALDAHCRPQLRRAGLTVWGRGSLLFGWRVGVRGDS